VAEKTTHAAATRQLVYGGLSYASYPYVRQLIIGEGVDPKGAPVWARISAGVLAGGGAAALVSSARLTALLCVLLLLFRGFHCHTPTP
jgi:hypothetical protein